MVDTWGDIRGGGVAGGKRGDCCRAGETQAAPPRPWGEDPSEPPDAVSVREHQSWATPRGHWVKGSEISATVASPRLKQEQQDIPREVTMWSKGGVLMARRYVPWPKSNLQMTAYLTKAT